VLTPGNTADCVVAETCVSLIPGITELVADKGYDTDAFRSFLKERGIKTIIPGKSNRKKRIRYNKEAYKGRNVGSRQVGHDGALRPRRHRHDRRHREPARSAVAALQEAQEGSERPAAGVAARSGVPSSIGASGLSHRRIDVLGQLQTPGQGSPTPRPAIFQKNANFGF
jgi:IS5 family transposase